MPRIGKPLLKPRLALKYPKNIGKRILEKVYRSYSRWQEILYPKVIARTPITKSIDPRKIKGFVRRHIKLVTRTGERGLKYKTISVPGGSVRGTPAYHALSAIYAYHGYSGRPLTIRARPGSVLTFPLKRGEMFRNPKVARHGPGQTRGPARWVVTRKVFQPKWGKPNPWIARTFQENKGMLTRILHQELTELKRRKEEVKVEVG